MRLVIATGEIGSAPGSTRWRNSASHRVALHRRETLWAWLSLLVLVICWDAATRLDEKVSLPRPPAMNSMAEAEKEMLRTR